MSTAAEASSEAPDAATLTSWLGEGLGARVRVDGVRRLAGGHPSGAWLLGTRAVGRRCFTMECVDGRSVPDAPPGGHHGSGWYREAGPHVQRAVWRSFTDALARLHAIDASAVPEASHGLGGVRDVLRYWRDALLDVVLAPIAPSVSFDMAHTCEAPEHWPYWRALLEARVSGWQEPARGWFEASRYGLSPG